jgi:hypothetical protein
MAPDRVGNSFNQAYILGNFANTTRTIKEFVGNSDKADFYKLSLKRSSFATISMIGLKANADIEVYDRNRRLIGRLNNTGNERELSAGDTPAGIYYLKVYPESGGTDYRLTVHTVILPKETSNRRVTSDFSLFGLKSNNTSPIFETRSLFSSADEEDGLGIPSLSLTKATDTAGSNISSALNLGDFVNRTRTVRESIGGSDRADYFKIKVEKEAFVVISITGLSENVALETYDKDGLFLRRFDNPGRNPELTYGNTVPGVYYLKVVPRTKDSTDYRLTIHSVGGYLISPT